MSKKQKETPLTFHAWATQQRNTNKIEAIHDAIGVECTNQEEVAKAFTHYFRNLFIMEGTMGS
jgi:hypothetical protein